MVSISNGGGHIYYYSDTVSRAPDFTIELFNQNTWFLLDQITPLHLSDLREKITNKIGTLKEVSYIKGLFLKNKLQALTELLNHVDLATKKGVLREGLLTLWNLVNNSQIDNTTKKNWLHLVNEWRGECETSYSDELLTNVTQFTIRVSQALKIADLEAALKINPENRPEAMVGFLNGTLDFPDSYYETLSEILDEEGAPLPEEGTAIQPKLLQRFVTLGDGTLVDTTHFEEIGSGADGIVGTVKGLKYDASNDTRITESTYAIKVPSSAPASKPMDSRVKNEFSNFKALWDQLNEAEKKVMLPLIAEDAEQVDDQKIFYGFITKFYSGKDLNNALSLSPELKMKIAHDILNNQNIIINHGFILGDIQVGNMLFTLENDSVNAAINDFMWLFNFKNLLDNPSIDKLRRLDTVINCWAPSSIPLSESIKLSKEIQRLIQNYNTIPNLKEELTKLESQVKALMTYSVGSSLYYMFTGEYPYPPMPCKNVADCPLHLRYEDTQNVRQDDRDRVKELTDKGCPDDLARLLSRMIHFDPQQRI